MNYRKSFARVDSDERGTILLVSDRTLGFRISLSILGVQQNNVNISNYAQPISIGMRVKL